MSVPTSSTPRSMSQQPKVFPLSCTTCRQRKIKCNRVHPCVPCQESGFSCTFPERQQISRHKNGRGTHHAKVTELANRLRSVEELLGRMSNDPNAIQTDRRTSTSISGSSTDVDMLEPFQHQPNRFANNAEPITKDVEIELVDRNAEHYDGCPFWTNICDQVSDIRRLISEPQFEEVNLHGSPELRSDATMSGAVFARCNYPAASHDLPCPSNDISSLIDIFIANVDPIVKILYVPTLRRQVSLQNEVRDKDASTRTDVLRAAVCFAAITSITDEACQTLLMESKFDAMKRYRTDVELALAHAQFIGCVDITKLQALVLFLSCLRSSDGSKATCALVALAVRLGNMLNLHRDGQGLQYIPFVAETRRRLWWQIVILDLRASEEWGLEPLIRNEDYNTRAPTNISDEEMDPGASESFSDQKSLTQMSFGLMYHEMRTICSLSRISRGNGLTPGPEKRQQLALDCQKRLNDKFIEYCNSPDALSWAVRTFSLLFIYKAWLLVHYPMKSTDPTTPGTPAGRKHMLLTSIMILELSHRLETNDLVKQWWWAFRVNVQWHALAVALTELCVQEHTSLSDRAWKIIETVFELWGHRVADTKEGYVWMPIKRLHAKACEVRHGKALTRLATEKPATHRSPRQKSKQDLDGTVQQPLDQGTPWYGNFDTAPPVESYPSMPSSVPQYISPYYENERIPGTIIGGVSGSNGPAMIPALNDTMQFMSIDSEFPSLDLFGENPLEMSDWDFGSSAGLGDQSLSSNWADWNEFVYDSQTLAGT